MQHTKLIKIFGVALLLACTAPVSAMEDLEQMIKNGTWDSNPARHQNNARPRGDRYLRRAEADALLKQREESRRGGVRHRVKISNFTEALCSISYSGFKHEIRPDHQRKTSMGEGSEIEIRHRGNIFRLRTQVPEIGGLNCFAPELILELLGEVGNPLPNPVIIEKTCAVDAAMVLFEHEGVPNMRLLDKLAKRRAMCVALALAPAAQPLNPRSYAQENVQPKHPKPVKEVIEECPICLEDLKRNDPQVSQYCAVCKGKMHARCLAIVKESFNECPTCRSAMNI